MKKMVSVFFTCLLLCAALLSSCAQEAPDPKAILGAWEYRNQAWCDFKEDGTCAIGGTTGTYSVSDDMVLTMTPKNGDSQSFKWAGSTEKVTTSNWFIADDTLYLNGGVYPRYTDYDTQAQESEASSSETETSASGSSQ